MPVLEGMRNPGNVVAESHLAAPTLMLSGVVRLVEQVAALRIYPPPIWTLCHRLVFRLFFFFYQLLVQE